jgi:hypothetical protein
MKPAVTASQVKIVSAGLRRSADQTRGRYFMGGNASGDRMIHGGEYPMKLTARLLLAGNEVSETG